MAAAFCGVMQTDRGVQRGLFIPGIRAGVAIALVARCAAAGNDQFELMARLPCIRVRREREGQFHRFARLQWVRRFSIAQLGALDSFSHQVRAPVLIRVTHADMDVTIDSIAGDGEG